MKMYTPIARTALSGKSPSCLYASRLWLNVHDRANVIFHAHKNKTTSSALIMREVGKMSLQKLLGHLHSMNYVTETQVKDWLLSIRIVASVEVLV